MNTIKKIVSVILCMALMCCFMPITAEEAAGETDAAVYGGEALGLINALEIADYEEAALADGITRAGFYRLAAVAGGYGEAKYTAGRFSDVTASTENANYIEALANAGIISANAMGKVYPDGEITLSEASAVLVKILGYSLKADDKGGYPAGYKRVALDLDLYDGMDGVTDESKINTGMAVQLIYNALDAEVMTNKTYGTDYKMTEGGSLMYSVFRVKHINDVLKAVDISRLSGVNDVDAFHIEIGELQLECRAVENIYDYLGYNVDVFYKERTSEQFDKIVYMSKNSDNHEITIDIEDVVSIDGQRVKYTEENENKTKTASFISGVPVIYNGVSTGQGFTKSMLDGKLGKIRLLDNNNSGGADVVFVDAYKNYVASYVDGKDYVMYNMYDTADTIKLDTEEDDPYTIIYDKNGKESVITKIEKEDVVSIYQSAPDAYQQYIRAYINGGVIEGVITVVRDNKKYITIDEVEYRVNDDCIKNDGKFAESGTNVKLYLDVAGRAARITRGSDSSMKYAYIMGARTDGSFEKEIYLKLYTEDGEFKEYNAASKVIVDGEILKNTDTKIMTRLHDACAAQFGAAVGTDKYSSVIRFMLNDKGLISVIDTVINGTTSKLNLREDKTESNDALFTLTSSSSTDYYRLTNGTLGPRIALTPSKTRVMLYPSPSSGDLMDEEKYAIYTASSFLVHDDKYTSNAFYTDKNSAISYFIGMENSDEVNSTIGDSIKFAVVDYLSKGLDENGQIIDVVTLISSNGSTDVPVKRGFTFSGSADTSDPTIVKTMKVTELKKGDIVRYCLNRKGFITNLEFDYRASNRTPVTSWQTNYRSQRSYRRGFVYDTFDEGYMVYFTTDGKKDSLKNITSADCELVLHSGASAGYYKYGHRDTGEEYVESISQNALKSYIETGNDCSEIIIQQYYGTPMAVMVLED